MKIFIDSDIILDLALERKPFYEHAQILFNAIDNGKFKAHTTPLVYANVYYILKEINKNNNARNYLKKLKLLLKIIPINEKILDLALNSDIKDFEDAIQYYSCLEANINHIITRNKKDYKDSQILVSTAEEFNHYKTQPQFRAVPN